MGNRMTDLLNKIERRLGLKNIKLPDDMCKDSWVDNIIKPDTLMTFSRFYPNKIRVKIDTSMKKDGYYFLDTTIPEGMEILGVRDIAWDEYSVDGSSPGQSTGFGIYDYLSHASFDFADVLLSQSSSDVKSLFSMGIYIDFIPPNKIRLVNTYSQEVSNTLGTFPIDVFITHSPNLMTISPTMMETFEKLATADVATALYEELKYFDGLETIFANIDLHLSTLEEWKNKRDDIINILQDSYVSASNQHQPMMFTIN